METLDKLREAPHWSYSAFNCYLTCPLKYCFQYIEKVTPEHTNSCFPFGRAIHAALSYRARTVNGELNDTKEVFASYFKAETEAAENLNYKPNESYDSLLQTGFKMLDVALENWQDDFAVKSVAESFSVSVPGLSKPLIGEYDMVVAENGNNECIVDFKTASARWAISKVHRDLQATVFCYARQKQTGKSPLFRYSVITKTKTPVLDELYTERRIQDFQRFELLAQTIESAVQREVFYPNEACLSCGDCQFKNKCRLWHARKR